MTKNIRDMNKERRKQIEGMIDKLDNIKEHISDILDDEQNALDNMPDSIQYGERGYIMRVAIDFLDDAIGNIVDAIDNLYEVIE